MRCRAGRILSFREALQRAGEVDEVMIIGGGQIYDLFLPKAERVYLTRVHTEIEGDARFPELDPAAWVLVDVESHVAGDGNEFDFDFRTYERAASP